MGELEVWGGEDVNVHIVHAHTQFQRDVAPVSVSSSVCQNEPQLLLFSGLLSVWQLKAVLIFLFSFLFVFVKLMWPLCPSCSIRIPQKNRRNSWRKTLA